MNNKILAALALTTALATGLQAQCQINSGAYVGLSAGVSNLGGKMDTAIGSQVGAPGYTNNLPSGISQTSAAGGIFAGYGMNFGSLWAAAELYYQFDQLSSKKEITQDIGTPQAFQVQSKSNGAWGANAHFGYVFNKSCVLYAIAGVDTRRFKVSATHAANNDFAVGSFSKSYTSVAFAPGLGVRINIAKNFAIRTEYKYAMHRNKNFNESKANPGGGEDQVKIKHKPQVQYFNVGLVYAF